jgi:hypothetical protein
VAQEKKRGLVKLDLAPRRGALYSTLMKTTTANEKAIKMINTMIEMNTTAMARTNKMSERARLIEENKGMQRRIEELS